MYIRGQEKVETRKCIENKKIKKVKDISNKNFIVLKRKYNSRNRFFTTCNVFSIRKFVVDVCVCVANAIDNFF
jgi:hypothetical protein